MGSIIIDYNFNFHIVPRKNMRGKKKKGALISPTTDAKIAAELLKKLQGNMPNDSND